MNTSSCMHTCMCVSTFVCARVQVRRHQHASACACAVPVCAHLHEGACMLVCASVLCILVGMRVPVCASTCWRARLDTCTCVCTRVRMLVQTTNLIEILIEAGIQLERLCLRALECIRVYAYDGLRQGVGGLTPGSLPASTTPLSALCWHCFFARTG